MMRHVHELGCDPDYMINLQNTSCPVRLADQRFRFGVFEVDFAQRELRCRNVRIHLQKKPFQILELLLRTPGALVTREELATHLWPGLHVSVSRGLNTAVNALRQALSDSSGACRYIETHSGLGYRFIAPVEALSSAAHSVAVARSGGHRGASDAHQEYLKGKYLQQKMTDSGLGRSLALFGSAIAQDPQCAIAHTALADTYTLCALVGMLPSGEAGRRARECNAIALSIDRELPQAQLSRAIIRMLFSREFREVEDDFIRLLRAHPNLTEIHRWYSAFLSAMGRPTEAVQHIRLARDSEPFSIATRMEIARAHYFGRNFSECMYECWQVLMLESDYSPAQYLLGLAYEQLDRYEEAVTEFENARASSDNNPAILAALGHIQGCADKRKSVDERLRPLTELSQRRYVSSYWSSIIYAGAGDKDGALASLEKASAERDVNLFWLRVEPRFDVLRSAPRFDRLLSNVGLQG